MMGTDIHPFAEVRKDGKWIRNASTIFSGSYDKSTPFDWRSYEMFGFLANVRNYSDCECIAEPRGLPDDSEFLNQEHGYGKHAYKELDRYYDGDRHSASWLSLKELLEFDYDQELEEKEDEDCYRTISYREYLPRNFFKNLEELKMLGDPEDVRVVFSFDN